MKNIKNNKYIVAIIIAFIMASCEDFLELNPDTSYTTLGTVEEVQALLDNLRDMNELYASETEYGANSYYIPTDRWLTMTQIRRDLYLWKGVDEEYPSSGWSGQYQAILNANVALEALPRIDRGSDPQAWDRAKGGAMFFRAFFHLNLSQLFAPPYDPATAGSALGLPLRTDPDPLVPSVRTSVQQTYDFILDEFREAARILPATAIVTTRPSKAAAYGAMARTFLAMNKYDSALVYADKALQIKNDLMDYNLLDSTAAKPISQFNKEELFYAVSNNDFLVHPNWARIDTSLYASYEDNDLRKVIFFADNSYQPGAKSFKGDYSENSGGRGGYVYGGIATDELFLIRAESYARTGDINKAMEDLNTLLETRYKIGTYIPRTAIDQSDAIQQVLGERRKELLYRGLIWTDIRRLLGTEFAITPKRAIEGKEYILSPDNPETRYTFLIPIDAILLGGITQNE